MNTVTHKEHQSDYSNGAAAARSNIRMFGPEYARTQFNKHFPPTEKINSLADYYYGKGYCDAFLEATQ